MRVRLAMAGLLGALMAFALFGWAQGRTEVPPVVAALEREIPRDEPAPPPRPVVRTPEAPPEPEPEATPAPDPHDAATREWIALEHRVRAFLGTPIDPALPDGAGPDEEDAAVEAALRSRLGELTALESELIAIAEDTSRPRRSLEATVTLGEVYADMGASVEQLPAPADLGPRRAARWARENDERAAVHFDKARLLLDMASANGGLGDPALAERIAITSAAASPR